MLLTIAIISLTFYALGIISDIVNEANLNHPNPRLGLGSIMIIAWWTINFPTSIVLLIVAVIWFAIFLLSL